MSLPYYEPTKYDFKAKELGQPPKYEEQMPTLSRRLIPFYIRHSPREIESFTSQDAAAKYKSFTKIKKRDASFKHVTDLQQLGIGLPLMEAHFKLCLGLLEGTFGTIFKYVPPPPGSNRTFNKKTDKFKFCTVILKREWQHTRYTFTILPNPNNPSDTFQFSMFRHSKLPIIDVSPIRGSPRRYRWIITDPRGYIREDYTYMLYCLDEKQKSMIDNMDVTNQKLDKANSILNTTSSMIPNKKINEYKSLDTTGELVRLILIGFDPQYLPKDKVGELTREKGQKITMSTLQEDNMALHVSQPQDMNLESIDSVSVHELALSCMSYVINFIEGSRLQSEKSG